MKQTVFFDLSGVLLQDAQVIEQGLAFVKECIENNLNIGIISNWDPISFGIMRAQIPEFFNLFPEQNIIIPHLAGAAKPSREIYEHALQKMNADRAHCFFIDDSKVNVIAAQEYGMTAVHHTDWKATREELIICGLKLRNKQ
jgi:FMN phosphatase YigB (HAD superfamily)